MKLAPRIAVALALISSAGLANAAMLVNDPNSGAIPTLLAFPNFAATQNPVNYQGNAMDFWYFQVSGTLAVEMLFSVYNSVTGLTAHLFPCTNNLPSTSCSRGTEIGSGIGTGGSQDQSLGPGFYEVAITGTPVFLSGTGPAQYVAQVKVLPLPAAVWLLLSGLIGLGVAARRRRPAVEV